MQQKFIHGLSARGFHRLAYYEWGAADATRTIVCVHGLTRNARDFDVLAASLASDCRVICVDIVGRGDSDWLSDPSLYAYPQYLADMTALLARLGTAQVDWIGTSMGGLIGILLAAQPRTPISRLVLNDVGPFIGSAAMTRIASYISQPPVLPDMAAALAYIRTIYQNTGPCTDADYQTMTETSIRPLPDGGYALQYDPAIAVNFAALSGDLDLWPYYDRISCPTLVLRGAQSDVLTDETAAAMTRRGPQAQLVVIPGIGHYPALRDAKQIDSVTKFLAT